MYCSGVTGVKIPKGLKAPVEGNKASRAKPLVYQRGRRDWF